MSKITALQGKANSGKSTTIKLLPDILQQNGYSQVSGAFKSFGGDILDVFENGHMRVGITSSGDNYDQVYEKLQILVAAGCDICICACRTYDRLPPGSVAAALSFPGYSVQFVPKTYATSQAHEALANTSDANVLF